MSGFIKTITDATFEQDVIYSDKPVLVDFWSTWCEPSHALASVLEDAATIYGDQITFAKINIHEYSPNATKYCVRDTPTLILFKNGHAVETRTGALSESELSTLLENHINHQQYYNRWG